MAELVRVASAGDIAPGSKKVVELDGILVALFNVDNTQYYAVEDICTHDGGPLADGDILNTYEIECPTSWRPIRYAHGSGHGHAGHRAGADLRGRRAR